MSAKCGGYKDSGYLGPFENPSTLTFTNSAGESVTIKNRGYSLHQILIGDKFPDGRDANKYINQELKKKLSSTAGIHLTSFDIGKGVSMYGDSDLSNRIKHPNEKAVVDAKETSEQNEIQALQKKYGLPNVDPMTLRGMDYLFTKFTGSLSCKLEGEKLEIQREGSTSFYYDEAVSKVFERWKLNAGDCKKGAHFKVKDRARIQSDNSETVNKIIPGTVR